MRTGSQARWSGRVALAALSLAAVLLRAAPTRADDPDFDPVLHGLPAYQDGVPVTALGTRPPAEAAADAPPAPPGPATRACYLGAHPLPPDPDPRRPTWHHEPALHFHPHPPHDARLYALKDDCYRFVGDPTDFGFQGVTYRYYGAHPLPPGLAALGGGGPWCYIPWAHHHLWPPPSAGFAQAGPYYTWPGPFAPVFWSAWPSWVHYYRWSYPWRAHAAAQAPPLPYPTLVTPSGQATVVVPGPGGSAVLVPARVPGAAALRDSDAVPMLLPGRGAPAPAGALRGSRGTNAPAQRTARPLLR